MTEDNNELPDGANVCPGCAGFVEKERYKCEPCKEGLTAKERGDTQTLQSL